MSCAMDRQKRSLTARRPHGAVSVARDGCVTNISSRPKVHVVTGGQGVGHAAFSGRARVLRIAAPRVKTTGAEAF